MARYQAELRPALMIPKEERMTSFSKISFSEGGAE